MRGKKYRKKKQQHGSFCKINSKSKLWVKQHDGSIVVRYSFLNLDKLDERRGIDQLIIELYSDFFRTPDRGYTWKTAIIYDNTQLNGRIIRKFIDGKEVAPKQ